MYDFNINELYSRISEISCKLNSWKWDDALGPKPESWDNMMPEEKMPIIDNYQHKLKILTNDTFELITLFYNCRKCINIPMTVDSFIQHFMGQIEDLPKRKRSNFSWLTKLKKL